MRVGILSMQRIQNYGSFLQAYGLKCMLEELGCEVQFVDYHPGDTLVQVDEGKGLIRKVSKVLDVLKQNAPMKDKIKFIKYKKNYASKYYPLLNISNEMNYNPELDVLVIGSDEVFNCVQNNTNVGFTPELFGYGNRADKLISYAASFGNTTIEKLTQYGVKDKVAKWLKDFDAISVRDENSGEIVKKLTGIDPVYNMDPVLMYDFINDCKDIPVNTPDKNYMIIYGYSGRFNKEECEAVRKFADTKGLKIVCIGGVQGCCDEFVDIDPFSVISYFQHADYVVTDTFHGTILAVITHRQFVTIVRENGYGNSQKLIDLLNRLELYDRRIDDVLSIEQKLPEIIDFSNSMNIIEKNRVNTKHYLEKWVK